MTDPVRRTNRCPDCVSGQNYPCPITFTPNGEIYIECGRGHGVGMSDDPTPSTADPDLRALSDAATPGPWEATAMPDDAPVIAVSHAVAGAVSALFDADWGTQADADFIVALVNAYRSGALVDGAALDSQVEPERPAPDWPDAHTLIVQVRENLGLFAGAQPRPPIDVWHETLEAIRALVAAAAGSQVEGDSTCNFADAGVTGAEATADYCYAHQDFCE